MIPGSIFAKLFRGVPRSARLSLLVLIVLAAVLGLMQYATDGRAAYTMDSLTYRDAALQFLSGHPLQATNVSSPVPELQPLVHWPPAYPALWAAAVSVGSGDIDKVSSMLNPLLLVITTLAIFWICKMVTGSAAVASVIAVVNAFTPMSMIVYGHAWSETLFIPLLLLAYAAFWKYRGAGEKITWLAIAAVLIGCSNWVRYAGVVFLPLLGFSVLAASGSALGKRIAHAAGAMLVAAAVAFPLWLHNWQLTGNISGSNRGGMTRMDRLFDDMATIADLFEHSFFAFSMVLRANLEVPILLAAVFVAYRAYRRSGMQWLRPPEIWLPLVWLTGYLAFLLYARKVQVTVDLDLRMLAVGFPFLLLAMAPAVGAAFSERSLELRKVLVTLLLGLLVYAGVDQAQKVRQSYASDGVPRWRSNFGLGFRDLRDTSPTSRALKESIGLVNPSTVVLTDYRALYLRYLTGAKVYSPSAGCASWEEVPDGGMLFIGAAKLPEWAADCLKEKPQWRLLWPSGKAVPSMYAN